MVVLVVGGVAVVVVVEGGGVIVVEVVGEGGLVVLVTPGGRVVVVDVVAGGASVVVLVEGGGAVVVVLFPGTVVVVVEPPPSDFSSRTTPPVLEHCQGCTVFTRMTGVEFTVKLVDRSVMEPSPQESGGKGIVAPSGVLQSIEKSNTPRPRAFTSRRQPGWLPSAGPR